MGIGIGWYKICIVNWPVLLLKLEKDVCKMIHYLYILGISINQYLMIPTELVYLSIIHKVHKLGYGFPMSLYFRKVHLPLHIPTLFIGQK